MALGFPTALRTTRATTLLTAIDAGGAAGVLELYTGARPATGAAITDQTLLGTLTFSYPCGEVVDGVLTFDAITQDAEADADGEAAWGRIKTSADAFVMDLDVTDTGGGGDIELNDATISAGGPIAVTGTKQIAEGNA
ncbi:MAG: hypothetical protein C0621_07470 [Desulfuromonas sp.]|nr:MAG: hypothetical protein C0621_07470 [Desulfuromonas sp.]